MSDYEILKYKIGEQDVQSISTITFLGWIANKLNNVSTSSPQRNELTIAISTPPIGKLSDETKISMVKKLISIGVILWIK